MNVLKTLAIAAASLVLSLGAAQAEGQKTAKDVSFSFEWPFGHFDRAQLQRGYKVYKEVCANCHAMHQMSFRNLSQPGGPIRRSAVSRWSPSTVVIAPWSPSLAR